MLEWLEWWLIDANCWLVLSFMALSCAVKDGLWLNCGLILVWGTMLVAVPTLCFVWLISVISAVWIGLPTSLVLELCRRISHSKVQRQSWVIKSRSSRGTNSCSVHWVANTHFAAALDRLVRSSYACFASADERLSHLIRHAST